jgi:predicted nucleic acid-binding protein
VVIVADSSAWIELFRDTGSPAANTLERRLDDGSTIAVTEVIAMELLAGTGSARAWTALREHLLAFPVLRLRGLVGYERAAELFRRCRLGGETVRKLTDCLVAVPVIEAGATLLTADRDFEVLARHTPLRLEPLDA